MVSVWRSLLCPYTSTTALHYLPSLIIRLFHRFHCLFYSVKVFLLLPSLSSISLPSCPSLSVIGFTFHRCYDLSHERHACGSNSKAKPSCIGWSCVVGDAFWFLCFSCFFLDNLFSGFCYLLTGGYTCHFF